MSNNSIGKLFVVTSFGESHGRCVGVVVDGCPAGLSLNEDDIQREVDKRKPQSSAGGTGRHEADKVDIISGIFNGLSTGAPICMLTWNRDIDSAQYEKNRFVPRPGHADYTAYLKYGGFNDYRGGGRFSGRITVGFVMAGAVARKLLRLLGVEVVAHTIQIGDIRAGQVNMNKVGEDVGKNSVRCADQDAALKMMELIKKVESEGDSIGGVVEAVALNLPVGLGEPVFDTLEGELARAFFAIPAVKGVEFGSGFLSAEKRGSENNDRFIFDGGQIKTASNHAGGILGGISDGMPLIARLSIKPAASIVRKQRSVDLRTHEEVDLEIRGRHDSCIVPRAVPVMESMMSITLCDLALRAGLLRRVIQ